MAQDPSSSGCSTSGGAQTPGIIRELRNYNPFSGARLFRSAMSIRKDSFVQADQAIGVFTSGGDSSGSLLSPETLMLTQ